VARELGVSLAELFVRMGTKNKLITAALWPPDPPILETLRHAAPDEWPLDRQLVEIAMEIAPFVEAEIPATFTLYAAGLRPKSAADFSDATPRRLRCMASSAKPRTRSATRSRSVATSWRPCSVALARVPQGTAASVRRRS
jgi:hypothetical protein